MTISGPQGCPAYGDHLYQEVKRGLNHLFVIGHGGQMRLGGVTMVVQLLQHSKG